MNDTPYRYTESGLDNVMIHGITVHTDDDGDEVVTISNITGLHKAIAAALVERPGLLSGKEIRFLRTEMGITQAELARILHKEPISIGRWERGERCIDENAETILRMLVREKLGLTTSVTVQKLTEFSVQMSSPLPIHIDGRDPANYKTAA